MTVKKLIKRLQELSSRDDITVLVEDPEGMRHQIKFVQFAYAFGKRRIVINCNEGAGIPATPESEGTNTR